jgi:hypothetical protein
MKAKFKPTCTIFVVPKGSNTKAKALETAGKLDAADFFEYPKIPFRKEF